MDVMMPDGDGLQATSLIKSAPRYARSPVIMVSGWSGGDVVQDSLKAGAPDSIVKPVEPSAALAKIARALHSVVASGV